MKIPRIAEALGNIDNRFLAEAEPKEIARRRIVPAVIAAALAAALCGITAFAIGSRVMDMRGLEKMKGYIDSKNEAANVPESLTAIDLESLGSSLLSEDAAPLGPGESRLTGMVAGRSGYWVTFEINLNDADFAEDIEDFEACDYEWEHISAYGISPLGIRSDFGGVISQNAELISAEDGVLMFAFNGIAFGGIPDEIVFNCDGFKLTDPTGRSFSNDSGFEFSARKEECVIPETLTSKEAAEIEGVSFKIDMDCCGLLLYSDEDVPHDLIMRIYDDFPLVFTLKDGTEITEPGNSFGPESPGWEEFTSHEAAHILSGRGTEQNGIYYGFRTVIDISQIEKITVGGAEFGFE